MDAVSHGVSDNKVRRWYPIHVWTGHDAKVATFLESKNFEVFLPRVQRVVIRPDGAKTMRWQSIMQGYIFVLCDDNGLAALKTQKIPHAYGILWQERVSDEEVSRYKAMVGAVEQSTTILPVPAVSLLHQLVEITAGPFQGFQGSATRQHRGVVTVELTILSRITPVEISASILRPVAET